MYCKTILFVLLFIFSGWKAIASAQQDSLVKALQNASGENRLKTLRNLSDLNVETPLEKTYLIALCKEAEKQNNPEILNEAQTDLALLYFLDKSLDSARFYTETMSARLQNPIERDRWVSYLNMRLFELGFVMGDKDLSIESCLETIKSKQNNNVYTQIESAYIIGISQQIQKNYKEAIPYLETALSLIRTLSADAAFLYSKEVTRRLSVCYIATKQGDKSINILENLMRMQEGFYSQELKRERPFYPINSLRIRNYASLLMNSKYMSAEQAATYLNELKKLYNPSLTLSDRYSYFHSLNNYYLSAQEYRKALSANDSLIQYAKQVAPYNLPGLYNLNSLLYEAIKDYPAALSFQRLSARIKDSLETDKANEQLAKLQVEYDLNKLNYEKTLLEVKSKKLLLVFMISVLGLVISTCAYLYYSLKKEKRMKEKMAVLKEQAVESEKLKSAFIKSICHEIRTPLNAIVGFSGLSFDETLDNESKQLFQQEINKNTNLLTSLINSMLEVSILDISQDKLSCLPVNIGAICDHSMEVLLNYRKEGIEYKLELPEEETIISTNDRYLGMVLDCLLNNANKFTETGMITLACMLNSQQKTMTLTVTDTGCGIPKDKYADVFERFIKLDEYTPGNGLGLYLSRLIVTRLGGEIHIDPNYTRGTRMVVQLPV